MTDDAVSSPTSESNRKHQQLNKALEELIREDPSIKIRFDRDSGQTIVEIQGELHLEAIRDRLKRNYKLDVFIGNLQNFLSLYSGVHFSLSSKRCHRILKFMKSPVKSLDIVVDIQRGEDTGWKIRFDEEYIETPATAIINGYEMRTLFDTGILSIGQERFSRFYQPMVSLKRYSIPNVILDPTCSLIDREIGINCSTAMDIIRGDGMLASVKVQNGRFLCFVWHERFPDMTGVQTHNLVK